MLLIDHYAYQNRWLQVPVNYKFGLYVLFLMASFSGVFWLQLLVIVGVFFLTAYLAHLSVKTYLKWYIHASCFIVISILTILVSYGLDAKAFSWSYPLGQGYLGINKGSGQQVLFILLRVYSCLVSSYFFILTVPFNQMVILFKQLHFPRVLLELIVLMYRFIFLVMREFLVMRHTLDLKFSFYQKRQLHQTLGLLSKTLFLKILLDNQRLNHVLALKFDEAYQED